MKLVHLGSLRTTERLPITERQAAVYQWIVQFLNEHGYQPSYEEIATAFEWRSKNAVSGYLKVLERKGYLRRKARRSRSIELL